MSSLYLHLFLALGLAASLSLAESYCLSMPISKTSGYLAHGTTSNKHEVWRCDWKLNNSLQASSGCRLMIFKVLETSFFDLKSKFTFRLPDKPGVEYSCSRSSWCRNYVKVGSDINQCKRFLAKTNLCNDDIKTSLMWPPVIITQFYKGSAVMSYQFLDYDVKTTRILSKVFSVTDIIVIATATVVLAILCVLIIIALCLKQRNYKRNIITDQYRGPNNRSQSLGPASEMVIEEQGQDFTYPPPTPHHDYATVDVASGHDNNDYLFPIQQPIPEYMDFNESTQN